MTWTVSFRMKNKPDLFQQNLYFKLNLNLEPTGIRLRGGGAGEENGQKGGIDTNIFLTGLPEKNETL